MSGILFKPELADAILAGTKTVTRRFTKDNPRSPWWVERCRYQPGRDYAICPGRSTFAVGRVEIVSCEKVRLGYLDDAEARREGFANAAEFEATWRELHGSYDPDVVLWRLEFKVAKVGR
jgi:hypothetical protein